VVLVQPAERKPQLRVVKDDAGMSMPVPIEATPSRPPTRGWRFLKAYWTTFIVISSYLSAKIQARFRSPAAIERLLARKHVRNARRIERTIIALQGLFIKVGQLISIMTNFLPAEFRQELEGLQDQVPPRPYPDIEKRIREEFEGKAPSELFAEFAERPIAAASIGQVHTARLKTGEKVAVKVQYPDIEEIAAGDLKILRRILTIVGYFFPFQGLDRIYQEVRTMILQELDFRAEADNVRRIAANFTGRTDVAFPRVVDELTTSRVLTTGWEDGIKIGDLERLDARKIDRKALARQVIEAYCQQIFVDGVYHADPHPGNVLARVCDDGKPCIVFLDFGAVAEVSPQMREGIIEFIQGAIARDTQRLVESMRKMGFIARGADERVFDKVIEYFHQRFQEEVKLDSLSLRDVKFDPDKLLENIADLRRMDISLRDLSASFFVPKEWILLERTVLLLMGLCTALDPALNPMAVIRPYLEQFVLGPNHDLQNFVVATTKDLALSAVSLPGEMRRFMSTARKGDLEVRFSNVDDAARLMYTLGHQAIYAIIGVAAVAFGVIFEGRHEPRRAEICWWVAGGAGVVLLFSFWTTRAWLKRRRRR
jgi:ubiquinone biosynthesis protein